MAQPSQRQPTPLDGPISISPTCVELPLALMLSLRLLLPMLVPQMEENYSNDTEGYNNWRPSVLHSSPYLRGPFPLRHLGRLRAGDLANLTLHAGTRPRVT